MKCQTILTFAVKGAIYYVTMTMVIFSRVKITFYFQVWLNIMFSHESSPGILLDKCLQKFIL